MRIEKILIVDDSSTSRMIIKRCFEIAGFSEAEYRFAGDGAEALELLAESPFDLLVTDLNMPKCDGMRLLKEIENTFSRGAMKIVVVSGIACNIDRDSGGNILGVVNKPLSPAKVAAVMGGNSCTVGTKTTS